MHIYYRNDLIGKSIPIAGLQIETGMTKKPLIAGLPVISGLALLLVLILQFWGGSSHAQNLKENLAEPGLKKEIRSLLGSSFTQQEFLPVNEAFMLTIQAVSQNSVSADFRVAEGYYLYRNKIQFTTSPADSIESIALPSGRVKQDPYFGEVEIYEADFTAPVGFLRDMAGLTLHASYQGCANDGICYAPVKQTFDLSNPQDVVPASRSSGSGADNGLTRNRSMPALVLAAFAAGLLLTFTPCVLPMIPILSSILAGQGASLTRTRGGLIASSYVLGTAVTWASMGALAGATGDQLQAYFQNIWAIGLLSTLLVVMALAMFGVFTIQIPGAVQERIQRRTQSLTGSVPLVFLLGLISALIIGACVSPVLISVLGIAIAGANASLGAGLMFAMALGMGLPLIALGVGAGYFMPRAGPWMEKVRQGFGVLLIALAIWFLGTLPQVPVLLLWGGFFILLSAFAGAARRSDGLVSNWQRFERGVGIILLVWGIAVFVGGLSGQRELFRPLPPLLFNSVPATGDLAETVQSARMDESVFVRVSDLAELQRQLETAKSDNRKVLIDYYADWCVDCVRMEETTFADPRVRQKLKAEFVALQIDVTDPKDSRKKQLKRKFGIFGPPATIFLDENGQALDDQWFYGYMDSEAFLALLAQL